MNSRLVEYGIQNESSDWRAHVCFATGKVYLYRTQDGRVALSAGRSASAFQRGIHTARGRLVRPAQISGCVERDIPSHILKRRWVSQEADESAKGRAAQDVVVDMIYENGQLVPRREPTDRRTQRQGVDIVLWGSVRIQVKCDYRGGPRENGGTGNLFLQTHERNPFGKY